MARPKSIQIRDRLSTLLPARVVWKEARAAGFLTRSRKVKPTDFVWALVFGFGFGRARTLASLRCAHESASGVTLAPSAFYARFGRGLEALLRALVGRLIQRLSPPETALAGELGGLKEVLATDATVIRLHDLLAKSYPSCRDNLGKAALKIHALMTVNGRGLKSVKITSERKNDGRVLTVGKWVEDRLLLFDLGYYSYRLFDRIRRNGGYFLTRLKANANPEIVAVHRSWRGASVGLVGKRLQDVLSRLRRKELDVEIEVRFKHRAYAGKRTSALQRYRLVGLQNPDSGCYHLYVTNLPNDRFSAQEVAAIYRARWSVELLFRSLKSDFALDQLPSKKKKIVVALLYASILSWLISRELLLGVRRLYSKSGRAVPAGRWTRLVRSQAAFLLRIAVGPPRSTRDLARLVESLLIHEAPDPHRGRASLLEEVQNGLPLNPRARQAAKGLRPSSPSLNR